ncbi:MAG TPA: HPr family phosphocarrier protein [Bacteroidetes bacterium]|nr:HPr family phosphocarrier protein [Bacteroidota bacterium]
MTEGKVIVKNKLGIHARPAALLVRTAAKFSSDIFLTQNSMEINCKSIMNVMGMAAEPGSEITITASGEDEKEAVQKLIELFDNKFEED